MSLDGGLEELDEFFRSRATSASKLRQALQRGAELRLQRGDPSLIGLFAIRFHRAHSASLRMPRLSEKAAPEPQFIQHQSTFVHNPVNGYDVWERLYAAPEIVKIS